eukprot:Tamp_11033.p1 GENE.Tamp_11033~~Tamp_11033.p1  ORF type:complete len:189 (+),score=36.97 Tamp_11033:55-567(+)
MSSRRERKAQEAEGRARTEQGIKPPGHRNAPMSPVAEVDSAQASRVQSPEARTASPLASPLRDEKKLARLRRRGQIDEFKKELVEEVFKSCCNIANLNCNLDQPTPLSNDGAVLVGKQLSAGCRVLRRLQRGCVCTLALRISRSLTTPCAPKDLSISVKHWLMAAVRCSR